MVMAYWKYVFIIISAIVAAWIVQFDNPPQNPRDDKTVTWPN